LPAPPVAVASGSTTLCGGGSAPMHGSGGVSCSWSPAAGLSDATSCDPIATPSSSTTYTLTVFDTYGQPSTNNPTVTITVAALPTAVAGGSATITVGQSTPLTGSGGVSCAWSPATGLDNPASCVPLASPIVTTTYALVVTSAAGCVSTNSATAAITVIPAGLADLVISALLAPAIADEGGPITLGFTTRNSGANPAGASTTRLYLSDDAILDPADVELGASAVPPLGPGSTQVGSVTATLPAGINGKNWVIAAADVGDFVAESNETNNTRAAKINIKKDH